MKDSPEKQGAPTEDSRAPAPSQTFFSWMRGTVRIWGFLAFICVVLIVFRTVALPFVLGILVAYILAPVLNMMCRCKIKQYHVPRFIWLIVLYAALLGLQAVFFTFFVPQVSKSFNRIVQETPAFWKKANEQWVPSLAAWVEYRFGKPPQPPAPSTLGEETPSRPKLSIKPLPGGELELDTRGLELEVVRQGEDTWIIRSPEPKDPADGDSRTVDAINKYLKDAVKSSERQLNKVFMLGQALVSWILGTLTTFILVFMISAFLLLDHQKILATLRTLVPKRSFEDFDNLLLLVDKGLSGAIRGQLLICVINGIFTWIGLMIFGLGEYALLLAILAGVMSLIPIFGSILSSIPIIIVALASGTEGLDFLKGFLILVWIIGIHLVEANLLNPKIIGTAAKIHPVVVIFAVVAGEKTYGPMGALLGVPLVSAVQAIFIYTRQRVRGELELKTDAKAPPTVFE